jgi:hypothetical protein
MGQSDNRASDTAKGASNQAHSTVDQTKGAMGSAANDVGNTASNAADKTKGAAAGIGGSGAAGTEGAEGITGQLENKSGQNIEVKANGGQAMTFWIGPTTKIVKDGSPVTMRKLASGDNLQIVYEQGQDRNRATHINVTNQTGTGGAGQTPKP